MGSHTTVSLRLNLDVFALIFFVGSAVMSDRGLFERPEKQQQKTTIDVVRRRAEVPMTLQPDVLCAGTRETPERKKRQPATVYTSTLPLCLGMDQCHTGFIKDILHTASLASHRCYSASQSETLRKAASIELADTEPSRRAKDASMGTLGRLPDGAAISKKKNVLTSASGLTRA